MKNRLWAIRNHTLTATKVNSLHLAYMLSALAIITTSTLPTDWKILCLVKKNNNKRQQYLFYTVCWTKSFMRDPRKQINK